MRQQKHFYFNKSFNRKGAFGVLFSLLVILVALPLWVGALVNYSPAIRLFALDAKQGLIAGNEVLFQMRIEDKTDASAKALLHFGDGTSYSFTALSGVTYLKKHTYQKRGDYRAQLALQFGSGKVKSAKLYFKVEPKWQPKIKNFTFNQASSKALEEGVYLDYEISCNRGDEKGYTAKLFWGDGIRETLNIFCGPAVVSHQYAKPGEYKARLIIQNSGGRIIEARTLNIIVNAEPTKAILRARFFIATSFLRAGERISFHDKSVALGGRQNIKSWHWDFGDGTVSQDINPIHIYSIAGRYTLVLTIKGSAEAQSSAHQWIRVLPGYEGKLISVKGDNKIYQIVNGKRHWIPTPEILQNYRLDTDPVLEVSYEIFKSYPRAKLVRVGASPDIYYLTENWMKRKIPNMDVFYSYGNRLQDVIQISQKELDWYPENRLIKYDNDYRVYYLKDGVKHWIKSVKAFRRHNFSWQEIAPVNWQEFNAYPTGSPIS